MVDKAEMKAIKQYCHKQKKVQPGLELRLKVVKYILRKMNGDVRAGVVASFI
jgi:hypothetical protein